MTFGPSTVSGGALGGRQDGATGYNNRMDSFIKRLFHRLKTALTQSVLQDAFLFRFKFDLYCHTISSVLGAVNPMIARCRQALIWPARQADCEPTSSPAVAPTAPEILCQSCRLQNPRVPPVPAGSRQTTYRRLANRKRIESVSRRDDQILGALQFVRNGSVGHGRVQSGVPKRSAGGRVQRHQIGICVTRE